MRKKLFILGVGAQKAGTSWLYSQLKHNANVDMGFMKEYHVFDALFSKECAFFRQQLVDGVRKRIQDRLIGLNRPDDGHTAKRLSFIDDTNTYFDFFDHLFLRNDEVEAVGDITPSYSMLDAPAFHHIKEGLESRGFTVKVIFLMRDPVERVWSQSRMNIRNRQRQRDSRSRTRQQSNEIMRFFRQNIFRKHSKRHNLSTLSKTHGVELRTWYDRTITQLEKVFPEENIHYDFYERFFTETSFASLTTFLGLELIPPDFAFRVNASPKDEPLDPVLYRDIANHYSHVYSFVLKRFGEAPERLWPGYNYLQKE